MFRGCHTHWTRSWEKLRTSVTRCCRMMIIPSSTINNNSLSTFTPTCSSMLNRTLNSTRQPSTSVREITTGENTALINI